MGDTTSSTDSIHHVNTPLGMMELDFLSEARVTARFGEDNTHTAAGEGETLLKYRSVPYTGFVRVYFTAGTGWGESTDKEYLNKPHQVKRSDADNREVTAAGLKEIVRTAAEAVTLFLTEQPEVFEHARIARLRREAEEAQEEFNKAEKAFVQARDRLWTAKRALNDAVLPLSAPS